MINDIKQEDGTQIEKLVSKKNIGSKAFGLFKSIVSSDKKIGDLNGKWASMFKLSVVGLIFLVPTGLTWSVWVTNGVFDSKHHQNTSDSARMPSRIVELEKQSAICNQRSLKIQILENDIKDIDHQIIKMDKNNTSDHTKILTSLDSMRDLLQYIKDR